MNNGLVSLFWIVQSRKASNQPVTSITQRSGNPGVSHINPMASTATDADRPTDPAGPWAS